VLNDRLDGAERADLAELASQMGATDTLRPLLEALGVQQAPATPRYADGLATWRRLTVVDRYPTLLWLEELRQTPWHRRPTVLWRAFLLTDDEIRNQLPNLPAGRWGLARGRLQRLRRVLPQIPKAAWYLMRNRGHR